ncbi:unnamed protein product [Malus baccata var. baccata]
MAEEEITLEYTPTWVVAMVCTVIVLIYLTVERIVFYTDKLVLGLIALLLTTFQEQIGRICITEKQASYLLPCKKQFVRTNGHCAEGKVPLHTATAWQHLQMFIFFLAAVHATFSFLTILFARLRISQWKRWEDSSTNRMFRRTHAHLFIRSRGGNYPAFLRWLMAFFKQFFGSVNKSDYMMMRIGLIEVLMFYAGWHAYFLITFIPLVLLLAVGTKLEYVITQMAKEFAERYTARAGDAIVKPSDDHFWFHKPELLLFLTHIIVFQNSFQLAFCFWKWYQYRFDSCMMGEVGYVIPRLAIGAFIQLLCSYSIFPLHAIVTQVRSRALRKAAISDESFDTARSIARWHQAVKRCRALRKAASSIEFRQDDADQASVVVRWFEVKNHESSLNNGTDVRN